VAVVVLFAALVASSAGGPFPPADASARSAETAGRIRVHRLNSPFQATATSLRVLLPDDLKPGERCRVLFVLPVHEDGLFRHGDGLLEVQASDVHNRKQIICVAPAFSSKPWYADHDQDPTKRDESHLLKTVIPFVESNYPVRTDRTGRLLIGFSKSGWGAMTLLLRHPDKFHKAVGWDPGIRVDTGPFDNDEDRQQQVRANFGSDANFEKFRISRLLKTRGKELGEEVRLFYFNRDGGERTLGGAQIHQLMVREEIPHRYVMDADREHRWDSGWVPEALEFLIDE
jgi:hypothetical protein